VSDQITNPLSPTASPLAEATPDSLNELVSERLNEIFNKPPLSVSDDDLRLMVVYYQKERLRFRQESQEKENKPKTRRTTPTSIKEALAIATEDLI
jgi:hypothetical protein